MRSRTLQSASLALLLFSCGCSSEGSAWGEYLQVVRQSFSSSFGSTGITRSQAAAIPYASLGYRINGSREAILVLATDTNGDQLWTAASHVVLLMRGGRVVRTVGLPKDVSALVPLGTESLPPLSNALRAPYRSTRSIDLPDIGNYGMTLNCVTRARGPQTLSIIGTAIRTTRIDESCQSAKSNWSFTDSYWIDAESGYTWHSVQHLHPSGLTLQIEVFRPPG